MNLKGKSKSNVKFGEMIDTDSYRVANRWLQSCLKHRFEAGQVAAMMCCHWTIRCESCCLLNGSQQTADILDLEIVKR